MPRDLLADGLAERLRVGFVVRRSVSTRELVVLARQHLVPPFTDDFDVQRDFSKLSVSLEAVKKVLDLRVPR